MSETYPKTVQVSMTEAQHEKLRRMSFESRESMQECVRGLIEGAGVKVAPVAVPAQMKAYREEVVTTGGLVKPTPPVTKFGAPVDMGEVITKKCFRCGDTFPVTELVREPKTGRHFCPDCVENMKNNQ